VPLVVDFTIKHGMDDFDPEADAAKKRWTKSQARGNFDRHRRLSDRPLDALE
jgi:hypothetical protein